MSEGGPSPRSSSDLHGSRRGRSSFSAAGSLTADNTERKQDDPVWGEWLSLYLDHYRRTLHPEEAGELASLLERGVKLTAALEAAASARVAAEGRWLVEFLARVEDQHVREVLVTDAVLRLQAIARRGGGSLG